MRASTCHYLKSKMVHHMPHVDINQYAGIFYLNENQILFTDIYEEWLAVAISITALKTQNAFLNPRIVVDWSMCGLLHSVLYTVNIMPSLLIVSHRSSTLIHIFVCRPHWWYIYERYILYNMWIALSTVHNIMIDDAMHWCMHFHMNHLFFNDAFDGNAHRWIDNLKLKS